MVWRLGLRTFIAEGLVPGGGTKILQAVRRSHKQAHKSLIFGEELNKDGTLVALYSHYKFYFKDDE